MSNPPYELGKSAHARRVEGSNCQLELGEYGKRAGIARANATVAPEWKDLADGVIRELAASGVEFTSEAVTAKVGQPTDSDGRAKPNAVGARFSAAANRGLIIRVGFTKAQRPNQHAAMLSLWRGKC